MPASAPRPGVGRRIAVSEELASAADDWVRIACAADGKDVTLRASSIGPEDERACQQQAGVSVWAAMGDPSTITNIACLYWMARRKNDERSLTFRDVLRRFPSLQSVIDAGIEIWVSDPDSPEVEGADEPVDPTPSVTG